MRHLPFEKALVISAHPDDAEFGCGATVDRLVKQGVEVFSAVFSHCAESLPEGIPADTLIEEWVSAATVLGTPQERHRIWSYPVRRFSYYRQEILEDMVVMADEIRPDLVLTLPKSSIHQDHQVIAWETARAFRSQWVLAYELPWDNRSFEVGAFFEVSEENVHRKRVAVACYGSQKFRHYTRQMDFLAHARMRGAQNKTELAEVFEIVCLSL